MSSSERKSLSKTNPITSTLPFLASSTLDSFSKSPFLRQNKMPSLDRELEIALPKLPFSGMFTRENLPAARQFAESTSTVNSILAVSPSVTHEERTISGPRGEIQISILQSSTSKENNKDHASSTYTQEAWPWATASQERLFPSVPRAYSKLKKKKKNKEALSAELNSYTVHR